MPDVAALLALLTGRTEPAADPALAVVKLARASLDALVLKLGQTIEARVTAQLAGGFTQLTAGSDTFVLKLATSLPNNAAVKVTVTPAHSGQPQVTVTPLPLPTVSLPLAPAPKAPLPALVLPPPSTSSPSGPIASPPTASQGAPLAPAPTTEPQVPPASRVPAPVPLPSTEASTPSPAPSVPATVPSPSAAQPTVGGAQQPAPQSVQPPTVQPPSAPAVTSPPAASLAPPPSQPATVPSPIAATTWAAPTLGPTLQPNPTPPPSSPLPTATPPIALAPQASLTASPAPTTPVQPTPTAHPPTPPISAATAAPTATPAATPPPASVAPRIATLPPLVQPSPPQPVVAATPSITPPPPAQPATALARPVAPPHTSPPLAQILADPAQAAARQDSIAPLLAKAAAALAAPAITAALPRPVLEAMARVLAGRLDLNRAPLDGRVVHDAMLKAGVVSEPATRPPADTRTALLSLRAVLTAFLGSEVEAIAPVPSRPPPPLRGEPARAPEPRLPLTAPGEEPVETARQLLSHTDAALSRLKLLQHASTPDARPGIAVATPELRVEVPLMLGAETGILQLLIERDGKHKSSPRERGWRMRFALNFSMTGEVGAEIALLGRSANVSLWAAEPQTADALEAMLPELTPALARHGLEVTGLRVRRGVPGRHSQAPGQLLDSAR